MRTVTFADHRLTRVMHDDVIAVWHNQNPQGSQLGKGGARAQPRPTKAQAAAYPVGSGGTNMRTYLCTSEGKVVHYMQGYWPAVKLAAEIRFAVKLRKQDLADRREQLGKQIKAVRADQSQLMRDHPGEFGKPVARSAVRKQHAAMGLRASCYSLSINLTGKPVKPMLDKMIRDNAMRGRFK